MLTAIQHLTDSKVSGENDLFKSWAKVSILLLALKINLKESVISRLGDTHLTFHFCPVG